MKAIVTVLFIGLVSLAYGQIPKGTWRLGPEVDFASSKTEIDGIDLEIVSSDLEIGVGLGYYIIDNLEIGVNLGILSSKDEVDNFESKSSGIAVGPALEYKIALSDRFYLPIGGGMRFNSITSEDDDTEEVTFTGMSYGLFTGLEFVESNKLSAWISIGPEFGSLSDDDTDSEFDLNTFGIGMGFSFYFGNN